MRLEVICQLSKMKRGTRLQEAVAESFSVIFLFPLHCPADGEGRSAVATFVAVLDALSMYTCILV